MNFLKQAFTTQAYQFKAALQAQDAAEVSRLLDGGYEPFGKNFIALVETGSPEILQVHFQTFGAQPGWHRVFQPLLYCLRENKFDRLEMMLGLDIDFNRELYHSHPLAKVFTCDADKQQKLRWLERMTVGGINKIDSREQFLFDAITHSFPEAADLAVRGGIFPRLDDEQFLRYAAKLQNKEMCLHLIEKHGADLERAKLKASFDKENGGVFIFLNDLQSGLKPPLPQEKPATIETLSQDMKELREMVAELTQMVKQQQAPVVRLDKNSSAFPQA
jgi:hypothetical protein